MWCRGERKVDLDLVGEKGIIQETAALKGSRDEGLQLSDQLGDDDLCGQGRPRPRVEMMHSVWDVA